MITLKTYQKKNPKTGTMQYFLRTENVTPAERSAFFDMITSESTITRHDVVTVLSALQGAIVRHLKDNDSVRLGDLGSFHITVKATGHATAAECSASDINAIRVQFTPSERMRNAFKLGTARQVKVAIGGDED